MLSLKVVSDSCFYCVFFVCHHAGFLFVGCVAVLFLLSNNAVVDMSIIGTVNHAISDVNVKCRLQKRC